MKSRGYCTSNENGVFEVNYTLEDNLLSKLFNWKREFRFTCDYLSKFNYKLYSGCYTLFIWKDEEGKCVTDKQHLRQINNLLTHFVKEEEANEFIEEYIQDLKGE